MTLTIKPVVDQADLDVFVKIPWQIYRGDPAWVPPIIQDVKKKLDPEKNPFWINAKQMCWIAYKGTKPVGRICAIAEIPEKDSTPPLIGKFGFFECEKDQETFNLLFQTAEDWLKQSEYSSIRGPYNPSSNDEIGFLAEGFDVRPVILAGHTPKYYLDLVTNNGFKKYNDLVARRYILNRNHSFNQEFPEKMQRIASLVEKRPDVKIRQVDVKHWEAEIALACEIYNKALQPLLDFVPVPVDEFLDMSNSFRPILDPKMALIAEVNHVPVGFALALPDVNQALQKANGIMNFAGTVRFLREMQRLQRVSFKILMMLPEYQGRGIEALLIRNVSRVIWQRHFAEVDMSLAGDENEKSNRFQSNLGFQVYLRYRIFEKSL